MALHNPPINIPVVDPNTGMVTQPWQEWFLAVEINSVVIDQTNVSDASVVSSISLSAGADSVDRATFNTDLATLVTEINALKDKINSILALLSSSDVMNDS